MLDQLGAYCPKCAGPLPEESIWIFDGHLYCSETCCKAAADGR